MIKRILKNIILNQLDKGKIIHLPGPRQVGKTTLIKTIGHSSQRKVLLINGDEPDIRELLSNATSTRLKAITGNHDLVIIDEAQRIPNIGLILKLMHDNIPGISIIATGSSAFDLANNINEPLTGRKIECFLYPLAFDEMVRHTSLLEETRLLDHRLVFGFYPEVVTSPGQETDILRTLTDSYLYKDILMFQSVKKPAVLEKLLQAIAFQIGNEVSYNELSKLTGTDNETVERYIDLLEKAYILFRLPSFSRNLRNEIKRGKKIYFFDNGIRNAIIKNFNPIGLRQDQGALWENFLISERLKMLDYSAKWNNRYFWRTHSQQEIDYIEEYNGKLHAYEFKWSLKKPKLPKSFIDTYRDSDFAIVNKENFYDFVKIDE